MTEKTKGKPDPIDAHVGRRLRARRSLLGMSQAKMAEAIGLTFQQIQKYERGMNRISAGRLWQFSINLEVPIEYFYEGLEGGIQRAPDPDDPMSRNETLKLLRVWYLLPETVRRGFYGNLKMLSREFEVEATNG